MKNFGKVFKVLFYNVHFFALVGGIVLLALGGHIYQEKRRTPELVSPIPKFKYNTAPKVYNTSADYPFIHSDSPRYNHDILWYECEYLKSKLDENEIEHPYLDNQMTFYELEEIRDEFINLLEENGIGY